MTAGPTTAGLWNVRSRRLIFRLRGHKKRGVLTGAAFVPGSHRIVTAGMDGTVRTGSVTSVEGSTSSSTWPRTGSLRWVGADAGGAPQILGRLSRAARPPAKVALITA